MKREKNTFGKTLQRLRETAGWSLTELAARAGLSQPYLSRLEAGEREPALAVAIKLARALGVGLETFDPIRKK